MMEFNNLLKLMIGLAFECLTNFIFQTKTLRDLRELRGKKRLTAKDAKNTKERLREGIIMEFDNLSKRVIGLAIEVHKSLGPGLLENTYKECLALEFKENGINFEKEKELPVVYKGLEVACGYRIDLKVENSLIIELKSVSSLNSIYDAQILTYMKLSKIPIGLLINFNVKILKDGIKRFVLKEFNREGLEEHEGKN